MAKKTHILLDFEIDKLTNSIENVITGDSFQTEVSLVGKHDFKLISKKNGWLFNWRKEFEFADRDVYKLSIVNYPDILQGLISLTVNEDHVYCI